MTDDNDGFTFVDKRKKAGNASDAVDSAEPDSRGLDA